MADSISDMTASVSAASPGAMIKSAREKAGIHLAILSVNLKVSVKQLEALEADQFDKLPEPVFARALAAKVCRFVKLDPEHVLALMPATTNGLKPLKIIAPDRASVYPSQHATSFRSLSTGKSKFLGFFILVLFLIFGFVPEWREGVFAYTTTPQAPEVVPSMPPPAQEPALSDSAQAELPKAMVFESSAPVQGNTTPINLNPIIPEPKK